ncbi:ferrochelatase [Enterococcus hermanniensis]|uniref:Coproporphyrin III ferrochelatase n=1 Tax=Enterococcus hermanniensis TaxID=249189 RepID=A0A1L8TQV2_9ENTE|nr:ferrochelatase [Enterococcus hermanniensis]OJG46522.1 ferrochelatase [Enterococcus hermanniensis]
MQRGILLVNLGTPESPTPTAVKSYLAEFLSDRRVITWPRIIWLPILHGIVLNVRPKKSAKLYSKIWQTDGSPLWIYTQKQAELLQEKIPDALVRFAMTYGKQKIDETILEMKAAGMTELFVLPLYPQYSETTVAPICDQIAQLYKHAADIPHLKISRSFYERDEYITLLSSYIKKQMMQQKYDMLLFSYHGVPVSTIERGDPYEEQCQATTKKVMAKVGTFPYAHTYQSKFGPSQWLTPMTCETLKAFPSQNVKSVLVITPGFVADCLETIEEIDEENRNYFIENGGERFDYIRPFNEDKSFTDVLYSIVNANE